MLLLGESVDFNFVVGIVDLVLEVDNGLNIDSEGNIIFLKVGGSIIIEVIFCDE